MNTTGFYGWALGCLGFAACVAACGGAVTEDAAGAAGAAGAVSMAGGSGGGSAAVVCVDKPAGKPIIDPTCADLGVMAVTTPFVTNAKGGAEIAPGDVATMHVRLQEVAGVGFNVYPGVLFESDHPGVTAKENDWRYALLPCDVSEMSGTITVSPSVPKGTKVTLTARVAMLNTVCPSAPSVSVVVVVQ